MKPDRIEGSCLCGEVRYELSQTPVWSHNCHCTRCRKVRGAPFASNAFVSLEAFAWSKGSEHVRSYKLPEAERFTHVFCGLCGSSLPFENQARGVAVVPMGSLDTELSDAPRAHIFVGSKAPWFEITDSLPQHPEELGSGDDPSG